MARSRTGPVRSEPADGTAGEPSGWDEDPLAGFPLEKDLRRPAWLARLLRGLLLVAIAAAALLAVVFVALPGGRAGVPPGPRPQTQARVRIESTPPGARVTAGGRDLGVTPLSLSLPPGTHTVALQREGVSRELTLQLAADSREVYHVELPAAPPRLGALRVDTTPPGALVLLDGTPRGRTPLDLADVEPGEHQLTVQGTSGSRSERVTVAAGGVASIVVPLGRAEGVGAGWLSVSSPIELQVFEGQELVGSSRMERIMLRVGQHDLRVVSASLGFEASGTVRVRPGGVERWEVAVPNGTISVNAIPWAEVFLDGTRIGETPIDSHPALLGPHDLVLRHPKYAEQRRRVTVSLKQPARLGVDMRR